jgi:hypothetical protein
MGSFGQTSLKLKISCKCIFKVLLQKYSKWLKSLHSIASGSLPTGCSLTVAGPFQAGAVLAAAHILRIHLHPLGHMEITIAYSQRDG